VERGAEDKYFLTFEVAGVRETIYVRGVRIADHNGKAFVHADFYAALRTLTKGVRVQIIRVSGEVVEIRVTK
jgi:hypothetical protein